MIQATRLLAFERCLGVLAVAGGIGMWARRAPEISAARSSKARIAISPAAICARSHCGCMSAAALPAMVALCSP
jgi:hypothetical protein